MATASQISTRALRRIGVIPSGATPPAQDITDATEELNGMLAAFEAEGLSGDVLPLDARFENAIVDMLAYRLCDSYGVEPSPRLKNDADVGWAQLQSAFFAVPSSRFDSALAYTGHYTDVGYIIGEVTDQIADWQASTTYTARQYVINSSNVYECVTGGTSASSGGPTTTAAEITDGSCVWCWRRVAG